MQNKEHVPSDSLFISKADEKLAVYLSNGNLIFHSLKNEYRIFSLKESLLPDLVDALIELQNKE